MRWKSMHCVPYVKSCFMWWDLPWYYNYLGVWFVPKFISFFWIGKNNTLVRKSDLIGSQALIPPRRRWGKTNKKQQINSKKHLKLLPSLIIILMVGKTFKQGGIIWNTCFTHHHPAIYLMKLHTIYSAYC